MAEFGYGSRKTNLIKWIVIYLVIGLIVYGLVWYFFLGGSYNYSGSIPSYTAPKY